MRDGPQKRGQTMAEGQALIEGSEGWTHDLRDGPQGRGPDHDQGTGLN